MTRRYSLHGISFEWNRDKAASNWQKHRIDFETACETFFDPFLRSEDPGQENGELRQAVVGLTVAWKLIFVVFVERGEILRIISARPATAEERNRYENL